MSPWGGLILVAFLAQVFFPHPPTPALYEGHMVVLVLGDRLRPSGTRCTGGRWGARRRGAGARLCCSRVRRPLHASDPFLRVWVSLPALVFYVHGQFRWSTLARLGMYIHIHGACWRALECLGRLKERTEAARPCGRGRLEQGNGSLGPPGTGDLAHAPLPGRSL